MTEKPLALVSGSARGIGLATAKALARDGARLILVDINDEGIKSAASEIGDDAVSYTCDIGDADQVVSLFDTIIKELGPIEILVNNAGVAKPSNFLDTPLEEFKRVIDVNLIGTFLSIQCAAKAMITNGIEGTIVNMSSVNAVVSIPAIASYCASKGAIMQLTKAAALALAPYNIRVNAVGPGSIDTKMMAGINSDPATMERVMSRTPLKRVGMPEEVAELVAFLVSKKASYITGETVYIDGGRLALNYTC